MDNEEVISRLRAIERRLERATGGQWSMKKEGETSRRWEGVTIWSDEWDGGYIDSCKKIVYAYDIRPHDAKLLLNARADLEWAVEELRKRLS